MGLTYAPQLKDTLRATCYPKQWHAYYGMTVASMRQDLMQLQGGDSMDPDTRWGPAARAVRVLFAASAEELVIEGPSNASVHLPKMANFARDVTRGVRGMGAGCALPQPQWMYAAGAATEPRPHLFETDSHITSLHQHAAVASAGRLS